VTGGITEPLLTIQEAIDRAAAINPKTGIINVFIADGSYNDSIAISGATGGYVQLNGAAPSQNNAFGVVIRGSILIDISAGPDDLINRQVIFNGLQINSNIQNTSTKQHTVIIQNCRFFPAATTNGISIADINTATSNRVLIDNCEYTNDYPSVTPAPCFRFAGATTVGFSKCDIQSRNDSPIIDLGGASFLQRLENCYIESQFVNPSSALLQMSSTSTTTHNIALNVFSFAGSSSTTAAAISITGGGTLFCVSNNFNLSGTNPTTGNVIQYAGTAPTLIYGNNSAVPAFASGIQSGITLVPVAAVGGQPIRATSVAASGAITASSVTASGAVKSGGTLQISGNVISNASNNTTITGLNGITMAGTTPSITGANAVSISNTDGTTPLSITNSGDNPHIVLTNAGTSTTVPVEANLVNGAITTTIGNQNTDARGSLYLFTNGKDALRCPTANSRLQLTYSPYSPTFATSSAAGAWVAGTGSFTSGVPKLLGTQTITLSANNFPVVPGALGTAAYLGLNGFINTCVLNGARDLVVTATYTRTRVGVTVGPFALYGCAYPVSSQATGGFTSPINGTTFNEAVVGERTTFTHGDVLAIQVFATYTGASAPTIVTPASGLAAVFSPFFF
jgi:hypothetical protein